MKKVRMLTVLLAALTLSAAVNATEPARLTLWVTDQIGATRGDQCEQNPSSAAVAGLPVTLPTLTEHDVIAWNAEDAHWTLNPERFTSKNAIQTLEDRCFVLAIDGKWVSSGIVLSSYSARLTGLPTLSVIRKNKMLYLQLTSGNHGEHSRLIHVEALNAVLGQSTRPESNRSNAGVTKS
jgi:hypothetical protein